MLRLVARLVLLAPFPMFAQAQPTTAEAPPPHVSPAFGVHYGTPLRASLAAGFVVDVSEKRNDGVIAIVEAGLQGNEISAGYFRMLGKFGSGYSLRAAAVRTGDDPWNASPHTTYAGAEAHWMIAFGVGGRVGYLRRVSKSVQDPSDNLASVGISIGY